MAKMRDMGLILKRTIYFTGLDRVGKSTVRKAYAEATKQEDITYDRSFLDNVVFDVAFRHKTYSNDSIELFIRLLSLYNMCIVFMSLNFEEINKRYKETEGGEYDIKELQLTYDLFIKYLKIAEKCGVKVVYIDCNGKSVKLIVNEIIEKLGGE